MAKKNIGSDRADPKKNKSLAIRMTLKEMPGAKAADVASAVKKNYGHTVPQNMIYMVKTKLNMKKSKRGRKRKGQGSPATVASPMHSSGQWGKAIRLGRQLLEATGSVENATDLLKALNG